jgi:hypothetical protein
MHEKISVTGMTRGFQRFRREVMSDLRCSGVDVGGVVEDERRMQSSFDFNSPQSRFHHSPIHQHREAGR